VIRPVYISSLPASIPDAIPILSPLSPLFPSTLPPQLLPTPPRSLVSSCAHLPSPLLCCRLHMCSPAAGPIMCFLLNFGVFAPLLSLLRTCANTIRGLVPHMLGQVAAVVVVVVVAGLISCAYTASSTREGLKREDVHRGVAGD
jgi:hypothetical protein